MDQPDELTAAIAALAAVFVSRIPATLTNMSVDLRLTEQMPPQADGWNSLHRQLHTMAGSSGSFGYMELGDHARELELKVNTLIKSMESATDEQRSDLRAQLQQFIDWVNATVINA